MHTRTSTYAYNSAGQVISVDGPRMIKIALPNGAFLSYTFDAAHRLVQIQDQVGNKIVSRWTRSAR